MNRFRVLSTTDPELYLESLRAAPQVVRFELTERCRLRAELSMVPFGADPESSVMHTSSCTAGSIVEGVTTDVVHLLVPSMRAVAVGHGSQVREISGKGFGVLMPDGEGSARFSAGRHVVVRACKPRVVAAMRQLECDADIDPLMAENFLEPGLPGLQRVSARVRDLAASMEREPAAIIDLPAFRSAHDQLLVLGLAGVLSAVAGTGIRSAVGPSAAALRRAEDFIRANAEREIDLLEMARHAGLSLRSLQILFRRSFDCTIVQYIQRHRLTLVRQRLQCADGVTSIGEIARRCGFSHLGHFANAYKAAFGEQPRETLRRERE